MNAIVDTSTADLAVSLDSALSASGQNYAAAFQDDEAFRRCLVRDLDNVLKYAARFSHDNRDNGQFSDDIRSDFDLAGGNTVGSEFHQAVQHINANPHDKTSLAMLADLADDRGEANGGWDRPVYTGSLGRHMREMADNGLPMRFHNGILVTSHEHMAPHDLLGHILGDHYLRDYFDTALDTTRDENGTATNGGRLYASPYLSSSYRVDDFHPSTMVEMANHADEFRNDLPDKLNYQDEPNMGAHLWLIRNNHGVGFYNALSYGGRHSSDRDELQNRAEQMGEYNLHVGDDDMIHQG
jgi:hypothetical protein